MPVRDAQVGDIPDIVDVWNTFSLQFQRAQNKTDSEIAKTGFFVRAMSRELLTQFLNAERRVVVIASDSENVIRGVGVGVGLQTWREMNPAWERGLHSIDPWLSDPNAFMYYGVCVTVPGLGFDLTAAMFQGLRMNGYTDALGQILHSPIMNTQSIKVHGRIGFQHIGFRTELIDDESYVWGLYRHSPSRE